VSFNLVTEAAASVVLLVEDDAVLRFELAELLKAENLTVLEASNALEAMNLIREHDGLIEWLITDIQLGGISGAHVAFEYRFQNPTRPIVFITGYDEPTELARMTGTVLLRKPFTKSAFLAAIEHVRGDAGPATLGL
jgi:CheY-like chemotaxis protein